MCLVKINSKDRIMSKVIMKLNNTDGSDYGYVGLKDKKFVGGVTLELAAHFKQKPHNDIENAYFYKVTKVDGKKPVTEQKGFLDQSAEIGDVFLNPPVEEVQASAIWAWVLKDGHLCAVATDDQTGLKSISLPNSDAQKAMGPENALFSNVQGNETLNVELIPS